MKRIAMVTTCRGRAEHLKQTLPKNITDNADYPNLIFVVLDYGSQDDLVPYLKSNHMHDIESGRLVVYSRPDDGPFKMAFAKNVAHRCGILEGSDILINTDSDNFVGPGFANYVSEQFQTGDDIFLWSRMIKDGDGRLPRGISGRIAMSASAFLRIGGYNEIYENHGPDDKDAHFRLKKLGLDGREIEPRFLNAIRHNDRVRYREYPHAAQNCAEDFQVNPQSAIANAGKVGCGTVWRNFSDTPLEIRPIPTRIFGVGMHKTATTSLHTAFQILGLKSGHWKSAHWAKAIWREMNQDGHSETLERCYALSDLPIPLLYRQLDKAYPGSKFILTVRSESNWLSSVQRHFDPSHNRFRCQWDSDPFSHRIHQVLYGRTTFDPQVFLERYRRHNADVLDYFKHRRPQDLLVMDMEKVQGGWGLLCEFLNLPVPASSYPGCRP